MPLKCIHWSPTCKLYITKFIQSNEVKLSDNMALVFIKYLVDKSLHMTTLTYNEYA